MKYLNRLILITAILILVNTVYSESIWSTSTRLTWKFCSSYDPDVVADSNRHIHVVWADTLYHDFEILYKKSTNGGATWLSTIRLTWNSGDSQYPAIGVDSNDNLFLIWDDSTSDNFDLYFKRSTDSGMTWSSIKRLTYTTASMKPQIAIDKSDNIHLVWERHISGIIEAFYKKSTDGGFTWLPPKRLSWNVSNVPDPVITVDNFDNLHVVWIDFIMNNNEVRYRKSTNGGTSWENSKRLTWNSGDAYLPKICSDPSNNLHVVWGDDTPGNYEILYKKSTDSGASWSASKRLTWNSGHSRDPDLIADSKGDLHLIWWDDSFGVDDILYKTSTDGGATWSALRRLTWGYHWSWYPALTADFLNTIHVVWSEFRGGTEIYYKRKYQPISSPLK